jgi:hypothetical protein
VALNIDYRAAEQILERAALKAASHGRVDALWEQRARELEQWRSNRVAIAAFGTALLAKATHPNVDALSLHEDSGPRGYRPRNLAKTVLAAKRDDFKYALGTPGPDPLAASPWFGEVHRIDLIRKWRKSMKMPADRLVSWLGGLKAEEAEEALVAFLRVRMEVYAERQQLRGLSVVDISTVSAADLAATLRAFIEADPEDGRRGAAAVAAVFAAAGYDVVARPVNDPGQVDIDVASAGLMVIGIEVKQKPATARDAADIAEGAADAGASKALLCALDPSQEQLDDDRLIARADEKHGVGLMITYSVDDLLRLAMFSSSVTRDDFLSRVPAEVARFLDALDASAQARQRWKAAADRWAADPG